MARPMVTCDGNEAAARIAHLLSEVIAIYPITPSSAMGEHADAWSAAGRRNLWGTVPLVTEMQSEGGAAGAVHGALQTGALATTFTASQGLLLMIPNMYKIAGELTPTVFHVSARTVATHALSIFGDHSDVMAVRQTGFGLLASGSVQEAQDLALVAHAATLGTRVPFVHFFDGFRTSHEVAKIEEVPEEVVRAMIDDRLVEEHRARALDPDRPVLRGTAQNPDVFFQARERANPFYDACPAAVQEAMDRLASLTGRAYRLFDYAGAPDAERVLVLMGSGAETAHETVDHLTARGEKVGLVKVRLYRPFDAGAFVRALPPTVRAVAILDRTKEPGSAGEPLYKDGLAALAEAAAAGTIPSIPRVVGGRYGLSSKEFTPAMVAGVLEELAKPAPRNGFTVGIVDDVSGTSLPWDRDLDIEPDDVFRAVFFGLGADGTVSANKNSIKIIGEETDRHAQGYFVYDSKKAGAVTVSHLRFGPRPIRSSYLVRRARFVACHQSGFLEKVDMLRYAAPGAVLLVNLPGGPEEAWDRLPRPVQEEAIRLRLRIFAVDAYRVASEAGMGRRINTVMQTAFFAISGVLPREEAVARIKEAIRGTYGARGEDVVRRNFEAVDRTLDALHEVPVPAVATGTRELPPTVAPEAPEFVRRFTAEVMAGRGDDLPVSAFAPDGTFPTGTARWEKRDIALEIPVWDEGACIQCGKCALVCPHGCIRIKVYDPGLLARAPAGFKHRPFRSTTVAGKVFTIQTSPDDCTGCTLCVEVCPTHTVAAPRHGPRNPGPEPEGEEALPRWVRSRRRALDMVPKERVRDAERVHHGFFRTLPDLDRTLVDPSRVDTCQVLEPLFEYSGACSGCGETPYVKLVSQLFGDRALVANATGCSSIYGGNLPTTPWTVNAEGRGPAWSNSLFEDNAEFGLGFRLTLDKQAEAARELIALLRGEIGEELAEALLAAAPADEAGLAARRGRVAELRRALERVGGERAAAARRLSGLAGVLVPRSVWIVGGDGWAYDIGYGGLDHVLASGRDVNVLVLDTEVYSNTGGQMSKATPLGAVAKFAAGGKPTPKKDLALLAMSAGNVYVARVAMGADDRQTVRALREAESYPGPSLVLAYSHCIAHGIDMARGLGEQRRAVESGMWPLLRYDPRRAEDGLNPLQIDSRPPRLPVRDYAWGQSRFKMLARMMPERAERLLAAAQADVDARWRLYALLAAKAPAAAGAGGAHPSSGKTAEEESPGASAPAAAAGTLEV